MIYEPIVLEKVEPFHIQILILKYSFKYLILS
jgi:hypothetical protein